MFPAVTTPDRLRVSPDNLQLGELCGHRLCPSLSQIRCVMRIIVSTNNYRRKRSGSQQLHLAALSHYPEAWVPGSRECCPAVTDSDQLSKRVVKRSLTSLIALSWFPDHGIGRATNRSRASHDGNKTVRRSSVVRSCQCESLRNLHGPLIANS